MNNSISKPKFTPGQLYITTFSFGIILGVVIFIYKNSLLFPTLASYHKLSIENLAFNAVNNTKLLIQIYEKRFHECLILFLTQITVFKRPAACLYSLTYGFAAAVLACFYVQQYELSGIVIFLLTLIPHYLFYALAWHKLCTHNIFVSKLTKSSIIRMLKIIGPFLLFTLAGIICEASVSMLLLKYIFSGNK